MRPRHRYKPYIRRAHGNERTESLRTAYALAHLQLQGGRFYVMVQRGWPRLVIECARTASELRRRPLSTAYFGFNEWADMIKRDAQQRSLSIQRSCRLFRHKRWDLKRRRLRRKMN